MIEARLTEQPIDVNALLAELKAPENGAYLVFLGTVRNHHQGRAVQCIYYEAYAGMALKELQKIAREVAEEFKLPDLVIIHRTGLHQVGDASLCVVAGSHHRAAAYEASRKVVELIKHDVPIWKREYFTDGSVDWVLADKLVKSEKAGS
ncbi:molybdopterin synthase catalytic subunit [Planctomycetaceae bacterium]|nr:molybdopterin synthase catalytic subunit [Planctomycetaceae bacterium]